MSISLEYNPQFNTSGSFDFNLTRNEIIELALKKIGELGDDETMSSAQVSRASKELNMIVKQLRAEGIMIWTIDWITIPFTASNFVVGSDSNNYECIRPHLSSADNKPITGAQYTSFWKKSSTTGSTWAIDQEYKSIAVQELDSNIVDIEQIKIRETTTDRLLTRITREEYFSLGDITTPGKPTQFWFDRQPEPVVYYYPFPDSTTNYVSELSVIRFPEDFDTADNNPDLLQESFMALVDMLAYRLAPRERSGGFLDRLKRDSDESKQTMMNLDGEKGDTQFLPDRRMLVRNR